MARPGIEPRTSDLRVRCPTDCATRPGSIVRRYDIINKTTFHVTVLKNDVMFSHLGTRYENSYKPAQTNVAVIRVHLLCARTERALIRLYIYAEWYESSPLTHCILNKFSHPMYWTSPFAIFGVSG